MASPIASLLGAEAELLLNTPAKVASSRLHLPGPEAVEHFTLSDRNPQVLRSLQQLYGHGMDG